MANMAVVVAIGAIVASRSRVAVVVVAIARVVRGVGGSPADGAEPEKQET